jgi:tRNA threonylcarbamoyladenosine biosynthesis protein TsaB
LIVLGIDTALGACQAAVLDGGRVLAARSEAMQRGHQERLAAVTGEALAQAGVGFDQIGRIGVTVGPGSFTGLRVGLAFAKGLALALGVPLAGMGSLEALAASAPDAGRLVAAIDARRGQAYLQPFDGGRPLGAPETLDLEAALARLRLDPPALVIGPGAALFDGLEGVQLVPIEAPDPAAVARLAAGAEEPLAPVRPLYLRAPDARLPA